MRKLAGQPGNASLTDESESELNKFPDVLRAETHLDDPNLSRMSRLMVRLRQQRKDEALRDAYKQQDDNKKLQSSSTYGLNTGAELLPYGGVEKV